MRIAILHYWFLLRGGGERVVEILSRMYPDADLYCLLCEPESVPNSLKHHKVQTSFLNSIPMAKKIPTIVPVLSSRRCRSRSTKVRSGDQ